MVRISRQRTETPVKNMLSKPSSRDVASRPGLLAGLGARMRALARGGRTPRANASAPTATRGTGAAIYEALRQEQTALAAFSRNGSATFGVRVETLVAIDRRVDQHVRQLMAVESEEHWQGNQSLRIAFGRRLADTASRLAMAYRDLLDEGRRKYPAGSRGASRLPVLACRAIVQIGRTIKWCAYAKLPEPHSAWGRLYRLYRFAEKRRLLNDAVALGAVNSMEGSTTTCHREFARAVLFGLAEPRTFSPPMIDVAYEWCGEWADLIEFQRATDSAGERHCFDMDASLPPYQFHPQMRADRIRCFSTAAVCFKLVSLRDQTKYAQNNPAVHDYAARLSSWTRDDLIRLLLNSWVKARPARRMERESEGIKVARLSCGVDAITELLHAEAQPNGKVPPELTFEHWAVENESARGYGLAKRKICEEPEAGSLVCVRANGSPTWQLGVVRWERDGDMGAPRMGIETLADSPQAVMLYQDERELTEEGVNALLLPKQGVYDAMRSLVIPPGRVSVGETYRIVADKAGAASAFMIRLTEVVDETDSWSRIKFSVLRRV
jgi:hypothetical protein